ncbi:octopamine receptor beta-2R-like [Argopecten irradians]|uniref:octopamine receptor beta-2R-like n=1 Tax=Argopecten irradians TaxID=31199 RepID=UPI00371E0452
MSKYTSKTTSKVAPGVSNVNEKVTLQLETRETVVFSHSQNEKQHIRSESSEILRKKTSEEHKIVPVSACDLRGNIANSSTGNPQQRKSASLPASAPTSCKHTVQVVGMDGSVKITKTSNEHIAGAVCLMTSNNRKNGRRRVELRASKKIVVLIGTFLCCWLPLPVFTLFYSIGGQTTVSETSVCLLMVLGTVGCTSLAINPIILGVINRQLNSALKEILKMEKFTFCKE